MLKVNDHEYQYSKYPNGEIKFPDYSTDMNVRIDWLYENNEEFFVLQILVKYFKDNDVKVTLFMPFCPYGQQDRQMPGMLFSFKYFAMVLNDLGIDKVAIMDPHSLVMDAALKNCSIDYMDINRAIRSHDYNLIFYPDQGAAKKYSEVYTGTPYRFGNKKRNLETGEIISYEIVADKKDIEDKRVLIVDDICMGGRTFKEAAKALTEMGARCIGLQITHLMPQSVDFIKELRKYGIEELYTYGGGVSRLIVHKLTPEERSCITLTSH